MTKGLSEKQVRERRRQYGGNELEQKKKTGPAGLFLSQFKDILIVILALSTLFSVLVGQMTEAVTIIAIMLLNALMGFIQEYRTEKTIESLKSMTAPAARVWRGGQLLRLPAAELVPGDEIELRAGDRIPADARLTDGAGFRTDESILSGESAAVAKKPGADAKLYMGTSVAAGHGSAVVTGTGMATEMGRIASMIDEAKEEPTPLQRRLKSLGVFIAVTCVLCAAVVTLLGVLRGEEPLVMVLTGVSLAVAAIPEGLPAIVTIVLALSVNRILSRGAIIRRLHAVETLGCASVICADKTGTITENKMTVTDFWVGGARLTLAGGADAPGGQLAEDGAPRAPADAPPLREALEAAALCSNAAVAPGADGRLAGEGSPTEVALLRAAWKCGVRRDELLRTAHITAENPFDSTRKMMSVAVRTGERTALLAKGAPDVILSKCDRIALPGGVQPLTPARRQTLEAAVRSYAADAKRVIAVARRDDGCTEDKLVFLALCAMMDPPRREVKEAVRRCRRAGIRPVMITGDHALTARAVARAVGIAGDGDRVLEGAQIEKMDDDALAGAVRTVSVFARVSPRHKLRIVRAFRRNGCVTAMTGDGVNDAPAVKEADIGVAMGISGSDVTKEASSVVILDDNFATIVAAVEEGRIIYQNIRRFIRFLLTSNLGEVLTVVLAMFLDMPVIFIPIQILLINLVTDGLPAVALGMEPAERDIMEKPPRDPGESLFAGGLIGTILFRGAVLGLCNLLSFALVYRTTGDIVVSRSAAYLTLVCAQMVHVLECKLDAAGFELSSIFRNRVLLFACLLSVAVTLAVVYMPFLQSVFETAAVTGRPLLISLGCIALSPLVGGLAALPGRIKRKTVQEFPS
ncbi:MAG: cation-translocating P-type ATPase [Oscillospiraceae bacterium]|nr:cation-translocating P-type ATPase [Oscillospiraceae bacterium]